MGTDMYLNPPNSRCIECNKEIRASNFICWDCYQKLKGEQKVTTFEQAVNQWKEKYPQDNRMFSMQYYQGSAWEGYRSTFIGEEAARTAAGTESEIRKNRLIGISYKGEMYALFSEGTCIWEKENV